MPAQGPAADLPPDDPVHRQPIVDGNHVQARPSDFNGPEFSPDQSDEVDELYQQIQQMRAGETAEAEKALIPSLGREDSRGDSRLG